MSATVLLARHGTHDEVGRVLSGRSEIALNEAGRAEAARLGASLAAVPLTAIVTSPRRRAVETAAAVVERRETAVRVDAGLDEIDFGTWTGQSFAALAADPAWTRWNAARGSAVTPAGETMATVTARAMRVVASAAGTVLCVSHADVIRGVVAQCLGLDFDRLLAFDVDPGSLTTLAVDGGVARVVTVNERPR